MNRNHTAHPDQDPMAPKLADRITEHHYTQWAIDNSQRIFYIVVALILGFFLIYRLSASSASKSSQDFIQIQNDFIALQSSSPMAADKEEELLNTMQKYLKDYPELQAKYDGLLAQSLINKEQVSEAKKFAEPMFKRVAKNKLPFYVDFAQTSLLISEKKYDLALSKAKELRDTMMTQFNVSEEKKNDTRTFGDTLFGFNLLRIAMLEKESGTPREELAAWKDFKSFAKVEGGEEQWIEFMDPKAIKEVLYPFAQSKVTLANYIEMREAELKR